MEYIFLKQYNDYITQFYVALCAFMISLYKIELFNIIILPEVMFNKRKFILYLCTILCFKLFCNIKI